MYHDSAGKADVRSALPDYYQTLEEAFEKWECFVSDKFIYTKQIPGAHEDPFAFVSKLNPDLDRWIELHIRLISEFEVDFTAIAVPGVRDGSNVGWKSKAKFDRGFPMRNSPVFVDVPEPIQTPQFRGLIGIPALIWLKRSDERNSQRGDSLGCFSKEAFPVSVVDSNDREARLGVIGAVRDTGERSSQVVQRCPQSRNEVTKDKWDVGGERGDINAYDILSSIKIILGEDSIGGAVQVQSDFPMKEFEVMLRPTHLQCGLVNTAQFR